jgi:RNA polymerase sigma-70 factor, ECF subfamily
MHLFGNLLAPGSESSMSVTTESSDPELLERLAAGDADALAVIFRRHHGTVYRFSRQMLGSKETAEDVTQDVFVALVKSAGRFNPAVASLSTYLYGIARNMVLQRYKRGRLRVEVNIDAIGPDDESALAVSSDPADTLSRAEMTQQLRLAILRLPVRYREVVVLCELNGLSYEEAAAVAGCPIGTVRSRLSRARRMLIRRCRHLFDCDTDRAGSGERRVQDQQTVQSEKRWLILTKSDC